MALKPTDIRRLRQERGWSQAELARQTGMHPSTVSLIERGRILAYPGQILKISKALGIETSAPTQPRV